MKILMLPLFLILVVILIYISIPLVVLIILVVSIRNIFKGGNKKESKEDSIVENEHENDVYRMTIERNKKIFLDERGAFKNKNLS